MIVLKRALIGGVYGMIFCIFALVTLGTIEGFKRGDPWKGPDEKFSAFKGMIVYSMMNLLYGGIPALVVGAIGGSFIGAIFGVVAKLCGSGPTHDEN